MRFAVAFVLLLSTGCLGPLVAVGLGTERGRADLREHVDEDGIVYLERDPGDAVATVVMLHGFGGNKDHWTRFCAQMPDRLRLLALDLPGFGESPYDEAEQYDVETQAQRVHRFLERRGIEEVHLFGNSMGGEIAVVYALRHPERVTSLVLFDPRGLPVESKRDGQAPLVVRSEEDLRALMALSFVKQPKVPGPILTHMAELAAGRADEAEKIRGDVERTSTRLHERLPLLDKPALVVWGDSDRILDPASAALWRDRLPDADVVMMKQTGHAPMLERPKESAALVAVWWRRRGIL